MCSILGKHLTQHKGMDAQSKLGHDAFISTDKYSFHVTNIVA